MGARLSLERGIRALPLDVRERIAYAYYVQWFRKHEDQGVASLFREAAKSRLCMRALGESRILDRVHEASFHSLCAFVQTGGCLLTVVLNTAHGDHASRMKLPRVLDELLTNDKIQSDGFMILAIGTEGVLVQMSLPGGTVEENMLPRSGYPAAFRLFGELIAKNPDFARGEQYMFMDRTRRQAVLHIHLQAFIHTLWAKRWIALTSTSAPETPSPR